jgi:pyroglutamyl-peptidase
MKTLLITGFDPFGGQTVNPSWAVAEALPDTIGEYRLVKLQLQTLYGKAAETVLRQAAECHPDVILCMGLAGGRKAVTPEVVAINLREASIPDNAGVKYENAPVIADGPAAYFATLPVREMVGAIRAKEIPAALSYSAGTYVCNDVLYTLLHRFHGTETRVGFVHVPYIPQQVAEGQPSLPLEQAVEAIQAAIQAL